VWRTHRLSMAIALDPQLRGSSFVSIANRCGVTVEPRQAACAQWRYGLSPVDVAFD
jgi:hypothetical protein